MYFAYGRVRMSILRRIFFDEPCSVLSLLLRKSFVKFVLGRVTCYVVDIPSIVLG